MVNDNFDGEQFLMVWSSLARHDVLGTAEMPRLKLFLQGRFEVRQLVVGLVNVLNLRFEEP